MSHHPRPLLAAAALAFALAAAPVRAQVPKDAPAAPGVGFPKVAVEAMRREVEQQFRARVDALKRLRAEEGVDLNRLRAEEAAERERLVAKALAVRVANANVNVMDAQVQQWMPRVRPLLRGEYQYLRTVCEPTVDQRKPIARAGLAALKDVTRKVLEGQLNRRVVNGTIVYDTADPRALIQDALAAAAKESLTPEQFARYRQEVGARMEGLKRASVQNLVARLDRSLVLSADQREALAASLASQPGDAVWIGFATANIDVEYVPVMPDDRIVPVLSDAQKKVWSGLQKVGFSPLNLINLGGVAIDESPLDEAFPDEPPKDGPNTEPGPAGRRAP
jgi:hypothetical protein